QTPLQNIRKSKVGVDERNIWCREQSRILDLIWKNCQLLVGRDARIVLHRRRCLLREQSIGYDRVSIIKSVQVLVEHSESATHHSSPIRLPGKAKARCDSLELIRKLSGKRESRIDSGLWIDLEIFPHAQIKRQLGANLV